MYKIVDARGVGLNIKQFVIEAPRIARKHKPGQFIILRLHDKGERIPLTIKSSDPVAGTVTIVVQAIGKTTSLLNCLETGDSILDIVGPLGKPSEIENYGTVVVLAGSVGTAMALPTAYALKQAGNHVVFIEGARNKEMVVFEDEVRAASSETYIMTDDGSYGEQGLVTKKLDELIQSRAQDRLCAGRGPGPDDARRRADDHAAGHQDHGQPKLDHGGRHGNVRRLPRAAGQAEQIRLRGRAGVRRLHGQL
jgi:ferredoxin--NADP+ reductase